jgi:hypothetical protein
MVFRFAVASMVNAARLDAANKRTIMAGIIFFIGLLLVDL